MSPWKKLPSAAGPTCSRCNLVRGNGRSVESAGKVCPVMACKRLVLLWPEGEASLASELGKLHGFRRWCETSLIEMREARPLCWDRAYRWGAQGSLQRGCALRAECWSHGCVPGQIVGAVGCCGQSGQRFHLGSAAGAAA